MGIAASALRGIIRVYQLCLSPFCAGSCRFLPTCSDYAREAIALHGAWRGGWLGLWRLLRCNPWGGDGYDPVPTACASHAHRHACGAPREGAR